MEVKVNFKAGGSFVKQQPQFTANSENVCVAWKNQILCYSAKTGQLQATYKGISSHIIGFAVHHLDAFECITACSVKGELITWKISTHFKLLKKRINYKIVKSFHLIPSKSGKLEALVAYQEQHAVHFALYNINTDSSEDYRITLDNIPFLIDVCSDKYFVVAQMNRINYMKLNNFTKVFVHMIEKIRTFTCLACHPDEEKVLAGDTGGRVVLFENIFALKQTQAVFHWHTLPVKCVAFSNAGSYFYSGGDESVLVRWQVDNHLQKKFLPRLPASIERISVSNGNVHVAVATGDNAIRIVNSQFDKVSLIQHLVIGNHFDSGIIIDPRTKALVMNGNVGHVQFYSPFDGNLLYSVDVVGQNKITNERDCKMENTQVIKMAISKSGLWMATVEVREDAEYSSGYENRLKFWYFDLEKQTFKLNTCVEYPHEKKITAIQFQPCKHEDELKCATVGDDGKFKIWKISDATDIYNLSKIWQCLTTGYYGDLPCKGLSFSTDGSLIAVGFNENLTAWLPDSCHLKFSLVHAKFKEPITHVLFGSIRQSHLLAAASEKRLMIWNILTLSMTWTVPLAVSLLISDPISTNMAVITHDKKLFVFCPSKPEPIYQSDKLLKSRSEVHTAAFVPTKNSNDVRLDWHQRSSIFLIDAKRELFSIGTDETETTQNAYVDEVSSSFYSKMLPQTATNKVQSVEPSQHLFTTSINTIQQFLEGPIQTMAPIRIICRSIVESLILKTKSEPVEST